MRCRSCHSENRDSQKYCGECGAKLSVTKAERRELSVLFCDLVGSTQLSQELDPEDLRSLMREYRSAVDEVVRRFEGHIAQWLGDGALVYFGFPRAHEDDILRSVLTGLALVDAVGRLKPAVLRGRDVDLQVRVGIHHGPVVVGGLGGGGRDQLAVGGTPNLAARIQGAASPDTVLVSANVAKSVRGHIRFTELPPRSLKGFSQEFSLYRADGETGATSRMDVAARTGFTEFVGRETEVASLVESWNHAAAGDGQVVAIAGSAGLGKSRLVEVLKSQVDGSARFFHCQCSPLHRNTAYHPLRTLLYRELEMSDSDPGEERLERVVAALRRSGVDPAESIPLLAPILSLPLGEYKPPSGSSQRQKMMTLATLHTWLTSPSERHPVLFVVEDLHWSDPTTLEFVTGLANQLSHGRSARVMMVATYRPDEFVPTWTTRDAVATCWLQPLSPDQTAVMAANACGKILPGPVVREIVKRTDGVPLFVEELTQFFLASGALEERETRYELTGNLPVDKLPTTLKGLLIARLDGLRSSEREVAQLGATLGRQFSRELISAVAALDQRTLDNGLAALVDAHVLFARTGSTGTEYEFKHALIQEAAYDTLLRTRRQSYHERIARTLERDFPEVAETEPELLARHYTGAGTQFRTQALKHWEMAGQKALARADNVEAIAHLTQAIQLNSEEVPSQARDLRELSLQIALAPAQMAIMGWPANEVEQTCNRALELCNHLLGQGLDAETQAMVGQSLAGALWGLWTVQFLRGQMKPALAYAEQVLGMAEQSGNPMLKTMGHHAVGFTRYFSGEFPAAEQHARSGNEVFDVETERNIVLFFQFSSTVAMRSFAASSLWNRGYPDQAIRMMESALHLVREDLRGHRPSLAYLRAFEAYHWLFHRDLEKLALASADLRRLSVQEGFLLWLPYADAFDGIVASEDPSQIEEGLALLERGIAGIQASNSHLVVPELQPWQAERLITLQRFEDAVRCLDAGIADAGARAEGIAAPEHHRMRGEALARLGADRFAEAVESVERALSVAREQEAKSLELRAAASLCRIHQRAPRIDPEQRARARALLEETFGWFTEGFESRDLREAKALIEEIGDW